MPRAPHLEANTLKCKLVDWCSRIKLLKIEQGSLQSTCLRASSRLNRYWFNVRYAQVLRLYWLPIETRRLPFSLISKETSPTLRATCRHCFPCHACLHAKMRSVHVCGLLSWQQVSFINRFARLKIELQQNSLVRFRRNIFHVDVHFSRHTRDAAASELAGKNRIAPLIKHRLLGRQSAEF